MFRPFALAAAVLTLAASIPLLAGDPDPEPPADAPAHMPGPKVGDTAPDAQVSLTNGDPVQLGELYPRGPIVLIFIRGGWCPYCNKQLVAFEHRLATMASLRATVLALSPEGPAYIRENIRDQKLTYDIISDYQLNAAKAFGIAFDLPPEMQKTYKGFGVDIAEHNWSKTWQLPHPATYVIDRKGVIRYAFASEDYKQRADPDDVIKVLREIAKEK